jgi:hypothetical protein
MDKSPNMVSTLPSAAARNNQPDAPPHRLKLANALHKARVAGIGEH